MAHLRPLPKHLSPNSRKQGKTESVASDVGTDFSHGDEASLRPAASLSKPPLLHTIKLQRSILALVVDGSKIYAGTQGGQLLVRSYSIPSIVH